MISLEEVEQLHKLLIEDFGGIQGIRDKASLESALARPFQTFDEFELYPTAEEKAASLIESILINHPFIDGNKRTGYTIMRSFLKHHNLDITATQDEKYEFVIKIAAGLIKYDEIVIWLRSNTAII